MDFLLSALRFLGVLFVVIMVFNLMIVVHEWGHFLAARRRGLKVEAFQIWFGKPIWKRTYNGVQYGLGCIPFGGFVKLPQMGPMDAIEGQSEDGEPLPPITPLSKIIVAFAGPLFSFLLAVAFAVVVHFAGRNENTADTTRTIGYVQENSPAAKAGIRPNDTVESIDGKKVKSFGGLVDSIKWLIVSSEGDTINFDIKRPGQDEILHFPVTPEKSDANSSAPQPQGFAWLVHKIFSRPPFRRVGIGPAYTVTVNGFMANSPNAPAQQAGLQPQDRLLKADDVPLYCAETLAEYLAGHVGKTINFEVKRGEQTLTIPVTTRLPDERPKNWTEVDGRLHLAEGEQPKTLTPETEEAALSTLGAIIEVGEMKPKHPGVGEQLLNAARTISQTLHSITSPKSDLSAQHLSGVVGIVHTYVVLLDNPSGWWVGLQQVLWFSVVLNVNLAMLNLLPFPVLDGGHIVMALFEWVRRRPVNLRLLEVVQTACVVLLLFFMLFVTVKDTGDLFGASQRPKDGKQTQEQNVTPKFTAPAAQAH